MARLTEILAFLRTELEFARFKEPALNGLQVQGRNEINKIAVAVDAAVETAERAAEMGADALLVHHGIFWGKQLAVVGSHREFLQILLENEISLLAIHLPLDAHPQLGNNFLLARFLELDSLESFCEYQGTMIGCRGANSKRLSLTELASRLGQLSNYNVTNVDDQIRSDDTLSPTSDSLNRLLMLPFGDPIPQQIGIVSGAGADAILQFATDGIDTYITGEPRQFAYHAAKENRLNVIFAGHYATETLGVKELARALQRNFGISWEFIDCPTGI